ncbi:rhomboid family intramembrane serine protease [Alkalibacillus salilacus]|uniref:Membrane associated rhomboid family serine protease n=1 Tax=Alkalibacillus salilacus TaxID=284582 RepID=A0ABT9VE89_9BACI|nr:rhomboid family intramembrane serine protease [Alkalibacillus salilacus]MDQ0159227.1 membrane associated rhomboid family serine protease [Alkalibacillus salilacus]
MFFVRTESFKQFLKFYPVISTLVAIHIIVFMISSLSMPFRELIVGSNLPILLDQQYWRLVTPIFTHFEPMHLLFNTFSLIIFGPALEVMLGRIKFILAYLAVGIMANVVTLFLAEMTYAHVGASGAIFGLFGIYLFLLLMRPELIDANSRQIIIVIIIVGVLLTFRPGINIYAHIFGLIGGLALGPILFARYKGHFRI